MKDQKPTLECPAVTKSVKRILLALWIGNLGAAIGVCVYVHIIAGLNESVSFSNFRELVARQAINQSKLSEISGGPYSSPDDWWSRRIGAGFFNLAASGNWIALIFLLNVIICFYFWFSLARTARAPNTK